MFFNAASVTLATTVGQLVVASRSGYAFARFTFRGRDSLFYGYLGLIVPAIFTVFGMLLLRQFFLTIPREFEEVATLDGAGTLATFVRVIPPISGPELATLGIFAFMASWSNFLWPLVIVSDR